MQTTIAEGFGLSPQQRRLWSLMSRGSGAAYRVQCAVLVEGSLDVAALRAALEGVAARHEILRTSFHLLPGLKVPVQVIDEGGVEWGLEVELSDAPAHEQQSAVEKMFETMKGASPAPDAGPLVRASLLRLGPEKKVLLLDVPALCADAASMHILLGELARAVAAPADFADAPAPAQYADVSEYLSQLLEDGGAGLDYWQAFNLAELTARRPHFARRPAEAGSFQTQRISKRLAPGLAARVEGAALALGSTPELFLLACWHALLWRVTGWGEVVVGVAFDGRRLEGLAGVPGALAKYLPLDAKPEAGASFTRLLTQVGERAAAHDQWQDFFDWGAAEMKEAYLPLCYDYAELGARHQAGDIALSVLGLSSHGERFDLKLSCVRRDGELSAEFYFDPRQYEVRVVECLAEEFAALTENAAAAPGTPLAELSMLDAPTRRRLLDEFNRTAAPVPRAMYVHRMIEEQARLNPDAEAAVWGGERLSYAELNARANRLAHHLAACGVGPDVLVGVCFERSASMLVAMLGVLKAGGAYLPLDPSYPRERLSFMVEDACLKLVVTESWLAQRLKPCAADLVLLDEVRPARAGQGDVNPAVALRDENLAYVIYTSGSTGRPKGVMVTHGGLLNYVSWSRRAYRVAEGRGTAVSSSFAFDLTVTALFPPLAEGRRLVLLDEDATGELLADALRGRPDFSLIKITPAHLKLLPLLLAPQELEGATRALVVGGEALHAESLALWREHAPATRIINEYGPTETVVGCCVYEVGDGAERHGTVPIGRPIANTQVYVLDGRMEPAPPLAAGEIYIGGAGVARGYLGRPALTAERFVPDPFLGEPGARLYRTGDLGRHGADGAIEFLGRRDHQVKVKGYRIEPGEIEAALCEAPEVREAVVVVREESGEKHLVAYVTLRGAADSGAAELRRRLQRKLPEYMIPAAFVILSRLPLTPNGKVDRGALPEPDMTRPEHDVGYAAPQTPTEKLLAELWARALGQERVGIHDNFFEIGGDSILSIQIANRAHAAGVRLTPRQIFRHRTIAELAAVVEPVRAAGPEAGGGRDEEGVARAVPLTPIQHWLFEQGLPELHHWNQSLVLEVRRPLDPSVIEEAWRRLVAHHDALRLRFEAVEGGWRQRCLPPGEGEAGLLVRESLASTPEAEQEAALASFAASFQRTLDLGDGPVVRAAFIELGGERPPRLLLVAHHLCVDIVSWGVLLDGLYSACEQLARGAEVTLPSKTTPFAAWAARLAEYAKSGGLREELDYWAADERRWAPRLPVDFPSGANTEESSQTVWVSLDEERTRALLQDVPKVYRTMINDVLLTALVQSFSARTRARALLVDLENHGREDLFDDVDLSRTVGWFTCIFPLVLDLGEAASLGQVIKSVKEQVRRVPAGGIGYGLLRYMSGDAETARRLRELPQAELCFNYVGRGGRGASGDEPFASVVAPTGPTKSPRGTRRYLIEINGGAAGGRLSMAWTYSENLHRRETVEGFAAGFIRALEAIVDHCLSPEAGGVTPSDFALAGVSQSELDSLVAELGRYKE
ncbi:MAG: amino acid adenylation domain-containing protein [Pyrinomonadaceae bacterium]